MDEPKETGSEMLLTAGEGGGIFEKGLFGDAGGSSTLLIVKGIGVRMEALNLSSLSPIPADEDDRDRAKSLFRIGWKHRVKEKKTTGILGHVKTNEHGVV